MENSTCLIGYRVCFGRLIVRLAAVAIAVCWPGWGCREDAPRVVVYCSVDEAFGREVFAAFEKETGIVVEPVFDSEAGKTTGLIQRIRAEAGRPRADVLFSSELFNTIKLAEGGYLAAYASPAASDVPAQFRDAEHRWTAIGLRGRVLAFDPSRVSADELPEQWRSLADSPWAGKLAFANPLFGTTRGHVAAMFAAWGDDGARHYLTKLRDAGALMVDGNSTALRAVIDGRAEVCMTDTDDVWVGQRDGADVDLVYPDIGDGGTVWIPSSVAILEGARHGAEARQLVDFLVSARTERILAESASRNVPVRPALRGELGLSDPRMSALSYERIASKMEASVAAVREILLQ